MGQIPEAVVRFFLPYKKLQGQYTFVVTKHMLTNEYLAKLRNTNKNQRDLDSKYAQ